MFRQPERNSLCDSVYTLRSLLASDDNGSLARPKENEKILIHSYVDGCRAPNVAALHSLWMEILQCLFSSLLKKDFLCWRQIIWWKCESDTEGRNKLNPLMACEEQHTETPVCFPQPTPTDQSAVSLTFIWTKTPDKHVQDVQGTKYTHPLLCGGFSFRAF